MTDEQEQSTNLDNLFSGLELNEENSSEALRCITELALSESRLLNKPIKPNQIAVKRLRQLLQLARDQAFPPHLNKGLSDEFSRLGHRRAEKADAVVRFLEIPGSREGEGTREKQQIPLPVHAFAVETKRRIYLLLSSVIRDEIQKLQDSPYTYRERIIKNHFDLMQDLGRQFNCREPVDPAVKIVSLRTSLNDARSLCEDLKRRLNNTSQEMDAIRLEQRLKQAQKQASAFASELQKLLQEICPKTVAESKTNRSTGEG